MVVSILRCTSGPMVGGTIFVMTYIMLNDCPSFYLLFSSLFAGAMIHDFEEWLDYIRNNRSNPNSRVCRTTTCSSSFQFLHVEPHMLFRQRRAGETSL